MKITVLIHPPTGDDFEAVVDEDNNWEAAGFTEGAVAEWLAMVAETHLMITGGPPAQPDPMGVYANAIVDALPGSKVLTEIPLPPMTKHARGPGGEDIRVF